MKLERKQFAIFRWISVLLACSATPLVLVATYSYGLALSPDSASYVSAARSLSAGNGLISHKLVPLTWYPPLYPFVLTLFDSLFGLDPVKGARLLSATLFGFIVLLSGQLFRYYLATPSLVLVGQFAVLFPPVLFKVSTYAWSEPLLILWTLVFILVLRDYLSKRSLGLLLLPALVAGMASITRYIGLACTAAGVIAILISKRCSVRSSLFHLLLFGLVSVAPLCAWAVRNFLVAQEFMGDYGPSRYNVLHNLYFASIEVFSWFFPLDLLADKLPYTRVHFVLGAIFGSLVAAVCRPWNVWDRVKETLYKVTPVVLFGGAYIALLVTASTLWALEKISLRFMSPICVPVVLFILAYIDQSLAGSTQPLSRRILGFSFRSRKANIDAFILAILLIFPFLQVVGAAN
ncbi:MAG: glycosyltransferase family 39 protein [Caldilineaceae bacterium]|nr:glycosyltransferase family 39 protein [Caldilineaceae bacterium]